MARAYIIEIYDLRKDLELWRIKRDNEWRIAFNAFLAGLKAGKDMAEADIAAVAYQQGAERYKTRWHKVADGDYPPLEVGNFTVNVLTDKGDIVYYSYDNECWVAEPSSAEIDPPDAWCELPKYTDKEM